MTDNKMKLYYIYDALCGWCYGFSPVITAYRQKHRERFQFEVLSGGLVTGERIGPIGVVAGYIKEAYKEVEKHTGVRFGPAFLENILEPGEAIFTSVPPARAMALFRHQQAGDPVAFAARLQKAIYQEGLPPAEWTTYGKCAADFGLNADEFAEKMQHPKILEVVQEEFNAVAQWGIQGYPAVVVQKGPQAYLVSRGYLPLDKLETQVDNVLEQAEQLGKK